MYVICIFFIIFINEDVYVDVFLFYIVVFNLNGVCFFYDVIILSVWDMIIIDLKKKIKFKLVIILM